jgi:hypothetical protein
MLVMSVRIPAAHLAVAQEGYDFSDDFDSFDATKWDATAYFAPDFNYSCGPWPADETWLYIENTTGGVGDSAGHVGWKFYHTLPRACSGDFGVSMEFYWAEDSDSQMDHVRLSLDDATGDYQVNVGFEDSWALSSQRSKVAYINDGRTSVHGLPLTGRATLTVARAANGVVTVAWDGVVFAQGVCTSEITKVGLWLYGCKHSPGVACGVNKISAHFSTTTTRPDPPILGALFVLLAFGIAAVAVSSAVYINRPGRDANIQTYASAPTSLIPMRCPVCATLVEHGDQFCYQCGARLSA